jgi:tetratricopeptide (TPR) repeat protein
VPICAVAAMLAWVPNALIPAHYSSGYAWSGAYILFLPVMLVAGQRRPGIEGRFSVAAILVAVALSPLLFREAYRSSDNNWMLALETMERNQLQALTDLERKFPEGAQQHILVTGISFPFTLFHLPEALHWIYPKFTGADFDVVYYDVPAKTQEFGVKSISAGSVRPAPYTAVWVFNPNGTLRSAAPPPANWTELFVPDIGLSVGDLLIYPELYDVFPTRLSAAQGSDQGTPAQYYRCGTALLHYRSYALAEKCLSRAIELAPNNPYAYYFRALAEEGLGKPDLARASYAKAIEQDNPKAPNPAFRQALARLDAAAAQP